MRTILLTLAIALPPVSSAPAEQPGALKPNKHTTSGKLLPLKGASSVNSCAAYGPGFVKVEGSDTCLKIGGAVSIGAGGGR